MNDVSKTLSIMAAEGGEELSGNGELEESSGSLIKVYEFHNKPACAYSQVLFGSGLICRRFE